MQTKAFQSKENKFSTLNCQCNAETRKAGPSHVNPKLPEATKKRQALDEDPAVGKKSWRFFFARAFLLKLLFKESVFQQNDTLASKLKMENMKLKAF